MRVPLRTRALMNVVVRHAANGRGAINNWNTELQVPHSAMNKCSGFANVMPRAMLDANEHSDAMTDSSVCKPHS